MIDMDVRKYCPALKDIKSQRSLKLPGDYVTEQEVYKISINPKVERVEKIICEEGSGKVALGPEAFIPRDQDLYLTKIGPVVLECDGCPLLPQGFKTTLTKKYQ